MVLKGDAFNGRSATQRGSKPLKTRGVGRKCGQEGNPGVVLLNKSRMVRSRTNVSFRQVCATRITAKCRNRRLQGVKELVNLAKMCD